MESQLVTPEQEKEILRMLQDYTLPELTLRNFPYAIYPLADGVRTHQVQWLRKHQIDTMFDNEKAFQKFISFRIEDLALMTHRNGNLTRVRWIANMYGVFCVTDDKIDDTVEGTSPDNSIPFFVEFHLILLWAIPKQAQPLLQKMLAKMDNPEQKKSTEKLFETVLAEAETQPGTDYPGKVSPLGEGFRELWGQARGDSPLEWGVRFAREAQNFLLALLDETKNRGRKTMPTVPEYITMRRCSGCMHVVVGASSAYIADAHIPDDIYYSPVAQKMLDRSSDVTNWINDIFSLPKELKKGDVHNLVWLISQEQKCSLTEAAAKVAEMVDAACDEVHNLGAELEQQAPPEYKRGVAVLIEKCIYHITSFLSYHRNSTRYWSEARDASPFHNLTNLSSHYKLADESNKIRS